MPIPTNPVLEGKIEDYKDRGILCYWNSLLTAKTFNYDKIRRIIHLPLNNVNLEEQFKLLSQYSEIINKNIYIPVIDEIKDYIKYSYPGIYFVRVPITDTILQNTDNKQLYCLRFNYNSNVVQQIKVLVSSNVRSWDSATRIWKFKYLNDRYKIEQYMLINRISYQISNDGGMTWKTGL